MVIRTNKFDQGGQQIWCCFLEGGGGGGGGAVWFISAINTMPVPLCIFEKPCQTERSMTQHDTHGPLPQP